MTKYFRPQVFIDLVRMAMGRCAHDYDMEFHANGLDYGMVCNKCGDTKPSMGDALRHQCSYVFQTKAQPN